MWNRTIGLWLTGIGTQAKIIAAAVLAVITAWFGHKAAVGAAERRGQRSGASTERDRIEAEASREINKIKDRARETRTEVRRDTADPDALAERMRRGSTDHRRQ